MAMTIDDTEYTRRNSTKYFRYLQGPTSGLKSHVASHGIGLSLIDVFPLTFASLSDDIFTFRSRFAHSASPRHPRATAQSQV